jgi:hypothetical protein
MGLLDSIPIIGPALDALTGVTSAFNARSAFKHRYQDTVKDMKAAGLNPALAYGQGGGNPQTTDLPQVGESLTRAAGTAASAKQASNQAELTKAQTDLLRAQTQDIVRQTQLRTEMMGSESQSMNVRALQDMFTYQQQSSPEGQPFWRNAIFGDMIERAKRGETATSAASSAATQAETDKAIRKMTELGIPEAEAKALFYKNAGKWSPTAMGILQFIKALQGVM